MELKLINYNEIKLQANVINISYLSDKSKSLEIVKKYNSEKIVTTNGCFDILHIGHIYSLFQAKSCGTKLIVGINSDTSVRKIKGLKRPIRNEIERAEILVSLEFVDAVIIFHETSPIEFLNLVKPHIHCKGNDYKNNLNLPEKDIIDKHNIKLKFLDYIENRSTTSEINKINSN